MANSEAGTSSDAALASGGEYQVFLSFRGPDTRHGFTDFLYHELVEVGVRVFRDDDELRAGEVIEKNLLSAINKSIIYIPIFSRTYASSKWCLWELAHIVDNVTTLEDKKIILPVFLDVEPDDVKLKTPIYRDALLEHERKFPDKVKAWRSALAEVGKIKGWNVKSRYEINPVTNDSAFVPCSQAAIVKSIVKEVLAKLKTKQKLVTEHLVGLDDRINELTKLLDVNHNDVRLLGIYGMGGIGKTTIATVVFNQLCSHFGKCCSFLEGIRERLTKEGIVLLQKKLLSDIGGFGTVGEINDSKEGLMRIGATLSNKKVLVVLDDVDKKGSIRNLIGNFKLHPGSRIIITTRDKDNFQIEGSEVKIELYEMQMMDDDLALQLFCWHAFGKDYPSDDYRELSSEIVSLAQGLPLATKVIGSLLNGKTKAIWKETLARLKKEPEVQILETLKISYDDLDKYQKQIFLDIACFFFNKKKTNAIYMWDNCSFYPERGIEVLTSRCLIKILDNDKLWVHDQLIDLGRQIVRKESRDNLEKQSRLWIAEEALQILRTKERKHEVQALEIFRNDPEDTTVITNEEFERLPNLRFLDLNWGTYAGDFARYRSNLKWFSWHSPRDFKADELYLDRLVICKLSAINFKDNSKAWDLIKNARDLKVLSVTRCYGITTIPNISKCLSLNKLTIKRCFSLNRIESFIGDLQSLIELKIEWCSDLIDLPEEIGALAKLKRFSLSGCGGLRELPRSIGNLTSLKELDLSGTVIRGLPNFIGKLKSLRILRFSCNPSYYWKTNDWQLPRGINTLVNLEELDLSGHIAMKGEIPIGIGELSSLRILNLKSTNIYGIPRTINRLCHLETLNLSDCNEIQELPELPTSLTWLHLKSLSMLSVPVLSNLTSLVELVLCNGIYPRDKSKPHIKWIGRLSRLKKLELDLRNIPAPPELASLSHLENLILRCLDLKPLVLLPSSNWSLNNLSTLEIDCCEVEDLPLEGLPQLEYLAVKYCRRLLRLLIPLDLIKLRKVYVSNCRELVEIKVEDLSKSLKQLDVHQRKFLKRKSGLSYLKNLETLRIELCDVLTNVEGLDKLESLKSLNVSWCWSLRRLIDASGTNIPDDCKVTIRCCGDSIRESTWEMPLKLYREKVLLDTSNKTPDEDRKLLIEIEGDEQANGMVELEYIMELIHLIVEEWDDISVEGAIIRANQWHRTGHLLVFCFCVAIFLFLSNLRGKLEFPREIGQLAGKHGFSLCKDFLVIFVLLSFRFFYLGLDNLG